MASDLVNTMLRFKKALLNSHSVVDLIPALGTRTILDQEKLMDLVLVHTEFQVLSQEKGVDHLLLAEQLLVHLKDSSVESLKTLQLQISIDLSYLQRPLMRSRFQLLQR